MKMISASVKLSELYRHLRIDAEYYKPEYLALETTLSKRGNLYPLRKYCSYIKKGIFDISPELYTTSGVPLIRTSEIKTPLTNFTTTVYLDAKTHQENYKTELHPNDIVLTKIGAYIGDVAILPSKYPKYNFSQNVTGLSVKKTSINSCYLFAFLLSQYGRSQIKRVIMLSGQGKIELEDIRDLTVYEASKTLQDKIGEVVTLGQGLIEESQIVFIQAEELLLSELGLLDWQPKHTLSFVRNYSETEQAERIDAEYFQPKYDEIAKALKKYKGGWDTLGNVVNIKDKNHKPKDKQAYKYIELANIAGNGEITDCMIEEGQDLPSRARRKVTVGDVIVSSIEGSLSSIALIEKEYDQSFCSTGFHVINSKSLNSTTMLVLLKSIVGQMQLKKGCSGTILTAINRDELKKIILPIIDEKTQSNIQQKISESFILREKSKHLLECAKQAVEMAIEKDEKKAIQWLKSQT